MHTSYQYGGRSDDLEYMQEVLRTAERLGDQAYIARIKAQIEEIKSVKSGKKEDARRRKGQICKPGLPTMDPMSCRGDFMAKCVKDPADNVFKCCSTSGGKVDCKEIAAKVDSGLVKPSVSSTSSPQTQTQVLQDKKMTASPTTITPITPITPTTPQPPPKKELSTDDKKTVTEYYDLKADILKNIETLRGLKVKKDSLVQFTGRTPSLVYHTQQNNMDDCIRDESGKVLKC